MKKILTKMFVLFALVILVSLPLASANNIEVQSNTKKLVSDDVVTAKYFADNHGAKVRLMQLEKSVSKNKLVGEEVIDYIKKHYSSADVSSLEAYRDEIEDLFNQAKSITVTEQNKDEVLAQYKAIREASLEITAKFREQAHSILSKDDLETIRNEVKSVIKKNDESYRSKMKKDVRLANANRFRKILENLPVEQADSIATQLEKGKITPSEARVKFHEFVSKMSPEERKEMTSKAKAFMTKHRVARQKMLSRITPEKVSAISERINKRLNERFGNDIPSDVQKHVDEAMNHLNDVAENVDSQMDDVANEGSAKTTASCSQSMKASGLC